LRKGLERLIRDVKTGLLAVAVLSLIRGSGPMHGYGIRKALGSLLGSEPPESTLYDVLKRLEKLGILESYWARSPLGTMRKYYRISEDIAPDVERVLEEVRRAVGFLCKGGDV
jgi:PadR family transcriptional regulator PadR